MVIPAWMGVWGEVEQRGGLLGFSQHPGTSRRGVWAPPKGKSHSGALGRDQGRPPPSSLGSAQRQPGADSKP